MFTHQGTPVSEWPLKSKSAQWVVWFWSLGQVGPIFGHSFQWHIHSQLHLSMSPSVPQTLQSQASCSFPCDVQNHSLKAPQLSWGIGKVRVLQSGYVGMCVPTIGTLEAEEEDTF